jgi:hypothetical protein
LRLSGLATRVETELLTAKLDLLAPHAVVQHDAHQAHRLTARDGAPASSSALVSYIASALLSQAAGSPLHRQVPLCGPRQAAHAPLVHLQTAADVGHFPGDGRLE